MHYLPHIPPADYSEEVLGTALWLDRHRWEQTEIAVANGISRVLGGDK